MAKTKAKKHSKVMILLHVLFVLVICVLMALLFSMRSAQDDRLSDSILFLDAMLTDLEDTETVVSMSTMSENHTADDIHSHRLSVRVKNNATVVADCYLILNIQNETYKNVTVVDVPVLGAGEDLILDILFEMPTGISNFTLDKFC